MAAKSVFSSAFPDIALAKHFYPEVFRDKIISMNIPLAESGNKLIRIYSEAAILRTEQDQPFSGDNFYALKYHFSALVKRRIYT